MTQQHTEQLNKLIAASIELTHSNMELSAREPDFKWAMQQITDGKARIRLVIEYIPVPSVTCELIREEDGECLGFMFQIAGRTAH